MVSGFLGGRVILSIFRVEDSEDYAVLTGLFPRKMPFYLAVDFDSFMMRSQHRSVAMIRVFEFFMRVLTVYRFDTRYWFSR